MNSTTDDRGPSIMTTVNSPVNNHQIHSMKSQQFHKFGDVSQRVREEKIQKIVHFHQQWNIIQLSRLCKSDPQVKDESNNTLLHKIFQQFDADPIESTFLSKLLLQKGVNPNAMNRQGYTPLHDAVKNNQQQALIFAVEYNQDHEVKFDLSVRSPVTYEGLFHVACRKAFGHLLIFLQEQNVPVIENLTPGTQIRQVYNITQSCLKLARKIEREQMAIHFGYLKRKRKPFLKLDSENCSDEEEEVAITSPRLLDSARLMPASNSASVQNTQRDTERVYYSKSLLQEPSSYKMSTSELPSPNFNSPFQRGFVKKYRPFALYDVMERPEMIHRKWQERLQHPVFIRAFSKIDQLDVSQLKSQSYFQIERLDWESMEEYIGLRGINEIHHQSHRTAFDQEFTMIYNRIVNSFIHKTKQSLVYLIDDFIYRVRQAPEKPQKLDSRIPQDAAQKSKLSPNLKYSLKNPLVGFKKQEQIWSQHVQLMQMLYLDHGQTKVSFNQRNNRMTIFSYESLQKRNHPELFMEARYTVPTETDSVEKHVKEFLPKKMQK